MLTRKNFTKETKRLAYERSNGICECHLLAKAGIPGFSIEGCGVKLRSGHINYEHINPDGLDGGNDLDNAATLSRNCWRKKTNEYDLPTIAKANRRRDRDRGIEPPPYCPLAGTVASNIRKPFNGPPVFRDSGRPLYERKG